MDLLTNALATAFFRQHPTENEDRASGLQILLMIEAYETVQQHVRQQLYDPQVTGQENGSLRSMERILNHWLEVLHSVYDRSEEAKRNKKLLEHEQPLCNSLQEVHASSRNEC